MVRGLMRYYRGIAEKFKCALLNKVFIVFVCISHDYMHSIMFSMSFDAIFAEFILSNSILTRSILLDVIFPP